MRSLTLATLLLASTSLTACVEDLSEDTVDSDALSDTDTDTDLDTDPDEDDPPTGVLSGPDDDGEVVVEVHAWDAQAWVHLDIDEPSFTDADGAWSLAFQRYVIAVNGGVSGDAGVEVVFVEDLAYDDVTSAPQSGWSTDAPDADDDGEPERVFDTWYDYNPDNHVLTPRPGTWFVRSADGHTYALEILDYYSDAGDSGYPSLRYRPVDD